MPFVKFTGALFSVLDSKWYPNGTLEQNQNDTALLLFATKLWGQKSVKLNAIL